MGFIRKPLSLFSKLGSITLRKLVVGICLILPYQGALAGPEGGEITNGDGSITQDGTTTNIEQLTDRMTIDWDSFDINSDERVHYLQPSDTSISLNRINSLHGSEIHGRIDANGQVILMNPHGILFGENAIVNVGGMLATGLTIDPEDFMNGDFTFNALENTEGVVINRGLLNAAIGGSVSLLGQHVENHGVITAELGVVNFAVGNEAVVTFGGENFVGIRVTEAVVKDDIGVDPSIINTGEINAADGKVLLTASTSQDIFSNAVNHEDMDYGRSVVVHDDGSFTLGAGADVVNSGSISVSGDSGGSVVILGENIEHSGSIHSDSDTSDHAGHIELHSATETRLTNEAIITANAYEGTGGDIKVLGSDVLLLDESTIKTNGESGGGQILIGGDYRGENKNVRNAQRVLFQEGSMLLANANDTGNGGRIILWGDNYLGASGDIFATGIQQGGFVETSSGVVSLDLTVDVSALYGQAGEWLIDPYNIIIADSVPGGENVVQDDTSSVDFDHIYSGTGDTSYLTIGTLQAALLNGASVQVITTGAGGQDGDVTLSSVLDYNSLGFGSLMLTAENNININSSINDGSSTGSDGLNLTLQADSDSSGAGAVTITADINTEGGAFTATGASFSSIGASIDVTSPNGGGDINITANNGNASLGPVNLGNTDGDGSSASVFNITAEDITFGGSVIYGQNGTSVSHPVTLTASARGDITINSGVVIDNNFSGANTLALTLNADTDFATDGDSTDGVITINNGTNIWLTGGNFSASGHDFIIISSGDATFINTEGGGITIGTSGTPFTGRIEAYQSDTNLSTYTGSVTGDISIFATEDVQLGDFRRDTGTDSSDASGFTFSVGAGDDVIFNNAIELGYLTGGGINTLTVTAGNSLTVADDTDNADGIAVNAALTMGTTDQYAISFNGVDGGNATNFSNTGAIDSNGGALSVDVDGTITIGGDFVADAGDISLTSDGAITQSARVYTTGTLTLNSDRNDDGTAGSITLTTPTNQASSGLIVLNAQDLTYTIDGGVILDGSGAEDLSNVAGNLTLNATGSITDAGNWIVGGTTTLNASGQNITLDANHDFGGAVSATANDLTIHDAGAGGTAGIDFGTVTLTDDLDVTALGAITDSGTINVSDEIRASGIDADNRVSVSFDSATNQLNRAITEFATDVTFADSNGNFIIGFDNTGTVSSISGDLIITYTGGGILHDGGTNSTTATNPIVSVGNSTTITALGQNVQFDYSGNQWGTLSIDTSGTGAQDAGTIDVNSIALVTGALDASAESGSAAAIDINVATSWQATGEMNGASMTVDGNSGGAETFIFSAGSSWSGAGNLTVSGNNGNDVFQIYESTTARLNGGNNNDEYHILAANISVPNINGGGGDDTVFGLSDTTVENTWATTANEAGTITNNGGTNTVAFSDIENLRGGQAVDDPDNAGTFIGGRDIFIISNAYTGSLRARSGDDEITINAQWTGEILGGAGDDDFTVGSAGSVVNTGDDLFGNAGNDSFTIANGELAISINGGNDTDTIILTDTTIPSGQTHHEWTLTSATGGNVNGTDAIVFSNMEAIEAPDEADDSFQFDFNGSFGGGVTGSGIAAGEAVANDDDDRILYTVAAVYDISLGSNPFGVSEIEVFDTQSADNGAGFTLRIESDPDAQATLPNGIQHTWTIDGVNSGRVTDGTNTVTFRNFGNLQGNEADDLFTITNNVSAGTNGSIVSVRGTHDDASAVALVANEANSLTIDNGNNTFTLTGEFDGEVTVGHTLNFYDVHTLNGQGGDTLTARNQNNTWTLTDGSGANTVGLTVAMGTSPDLITFSGMDTLNGGTSDDYFDISTALTGWELNGSNGADTFAFDADGSITGTGIIGGSGDDADDRLIAREGSANTWALNATDASNQNTLSVGNAVYVSDFKGIEILEGSNTLADTYNFATNMSVELQAGAGAGDSANYSNVTGSVVFTVDATWGIETYIGNNDGLTTPTTNSTTLTYESTTGTNVDWNIQEVVGSVTVSDGINDGTIDNTITFININNLTGGDGNDRFYFDSGVAGISGVISGGAEDGSVGDLIEGRDVDTTWSVVPASGNASFTYANGLMSADAVPVPLQSTTQFTGFESINGGSADDSFTVGSDLAADEVLRLNAGTGTNTLTLPDSDQPITLGSAIGGLSVQGFATITAFATRSNSLTVDSSTNDIVTWEVQGANSGRVQVGSGADWVAFNNFQQLIGGDGNDTFDFNSTTSSVVRSGNGSIDGNAGSNTLILRERNNTIEVSGAQSGSVRETGQGADYIEQFSDVDTISGYVSSDDDFSVTSSGSFTGVFTGDLNGVGTGTGADTLSVASVSNETNAWRLLGGAAAPDRVQRINSSGDATSSITFSQMSQLTGGTGTDHFVLMAVGDYGGTINANNNGGGTDIDILDVSNISGSANATWQTNAVQVGSQSFQNIEQFLGNGSSQLTSAQSSALTWRIGTRDANTVVITDANGIAVDGANDGEVRRSATEFLQFINVATLTGAASQVDNFILQSDGSITGTMQGGSGSNISDTLTVSNDNSVWVLTAANTGSVNSNNFSGIEQITSNGSGDSLQGFNQANRWEVSGTNEGAVGLWLTDSTSSNETEFVGIETLIGNAGNDVFDVLEGGQITGSILGTATSLQDGTGDKLIVRSNSAAEIVWTIDVDGSSNTTAQITNRVQSASLIDTLTGSEGRDVFDIEDAAAMIIVDGAGGLADSVRLGGADQAGYAAIATWQINGGANETVQAQSSGTVTFSNVEQAYGTNLRDNVTIAENVLTNIYGRDGDDFFTVLTTTVNDINVAIDGGLGSNTLTGGERSNQWIIGGATPLEANTINYIDDANRGVVYSNIQTITGGTQTDTFELREATDINLVGNGGNNTLSAPHDTGTLLWTIDGVDSGNVLWSGVTTNFSDVQNLTGGVGLDQFIFADDDANPATAPIARLSGLINGGDIALTDPVTTDTVIDTLNVEIFTDGVVVELGPTAVAGSVVDGTASLPNVNAYNIEEVRAAEKDPESGENNQWLAITEADVVIDWNVELDELEPPLAVESQFNEGRVQHLTSLQADGVAIENTQTRFYNFGSLQGYQGEAGEEQSNISVGNNITGQYVQANGQRRLRFADVQGQVVVDISPLIIGIEGNATPDPVTGVANGNTLIRVSPNGEFNGDNQWVIDGVNTGSFSADYYVDDEGVTGFDFTFTGVNQLQGGSGIDTFTFAHAEGAPAEVGLLDGFIDGGSTASGGADQIIVNRASAVDQSTLIFGVNNYDTPWTTFGALGVADIQDRFPDVLDGPVAPVINRDGVMDIAGIETLTVNDGSVHLMSADTGTAQWAIGQTIDGSILTTNFDQNTPAVALEFTGVQRVLGGAADDTFNVNRLGEAASVLPLDNSYIGGAGSDVVNLTAIETNNSGEALTLSVDLTNTDADVRLDQIETLNLSGEGHRLQAQDRVNNWEINDENSGSLSYGSGDQAQQLHFSQVSHLEGGSVQDTFTFVSGGILNGTIDGSENAVAGDRIVINSTSTQTFNFAVSSYDADGQVIASTQTGVTAVGGIETITGDANRALNTTITGPNFEGTWSFNGVNNGQLMFTDADGLEQTLVFTDIANLIGGNQDDTFNFTRDVGVDDGLSGNLNGGDGSDTVNVQGLQDLVSIALGTERDGTLNVVNVETLEASAGNAYQLWGDNVDNQWVINGVDAGVVGGLTFENIGILVGGTGSDTFTLNHDDVAMMDDQITGLIDGGADPVSGSATDVIDMLGLNDAIVVSLDPNYVDASTTTLAITNVDQVNATVKENITNTFVGGNSSNNDWQITAQNSGGVSGTSFTGFNALLGRDQVDTFSLVGAGRITGTVDGGNQPENLRDIVDVSNATNANVVIGATTNGFENIEEYRGNDITSQLTAANITNTWTLSEMNGGTIVDANNRNIVFSGFANLDGGSVQDNFTINGGGVTGNIEAGAGNDSLTIQLGNGFDGSVDFNGQADDDSVIFNGGSASERFDATYQALAAGAAEHEFEISRDNTTLTYTASYEGVENVTDNVFVNTLTLQSLANVADTLRLGNNRYVVSETISNPDMPVTWPEVDYANVNSINVNAELGDDLVIDGLVSLSDSLTVTNVNVRSDGDTARINADNTIRFVSTGTVGSEAIPVVIDTANLALTTLRGPTYLDIQSDVNLTALQNPTALVSLNVAGDISDTAALTSSQPLTISATGNITLDNVNALTGRLSLITLTGDVSLNNGFTEFTELTANNATLAARGNMSDGDDGVISIANTLMINGSESSNVSFSNTSNLFNIVDIQQAGVVTLTDSSASGMTLQGAATQRVDVTADSAIIVNDLTSSDILLSATNGSVSILNSLTATNTIDIDGEGVQINGSIDINNSAAELLLDVNANGGALNIAAPITATGSLDASRVLLAGSTVNQMTDATLQANNIQIVSTNDTTLMADITVDGLFDVDSGENITMQSNALSTLTQAQAIDFYADQNIVTEELSAQTITLISENGSITQNGPLTARQHTLTANAGQYTLTEGTTTSINSGNAESSTVISAGAIQLLGDINVTQGNAQITSLGDASFVGGVRAPTLLVRVDGETTMETSSVLLADETLTFNATGAMGLGQLEAGAEVVLNTAATVYDNNASEVNIVAPVLTVNAEQGFGGYAADSTIETQVATLDVMSAASEIGISNTGDPSGDSNGALTVDHLVSNGDIRLIHTNGDIVLNNTAEVDYDRSATDARAAGGVINANYESGDVVIVIPNGALTATGAPNGKRPELVGDIINVSTSGGFGTNRQLVVYANTELIISGRGIRPIWAFGSIPTFGLTTDGDLTDPLAGGNVSDLLVEVEEVADVNPAVFTEVRNYVYEDISIRMPRDQIYDDAYYEDDEDDYY